MSDKNVKAVYVIKKVGETKYWTRVGACFVNRDGSFNVELDALPVDGKLHIRDVEPREEKPDGRGAKGERRR